MKMEVLNCMNKNKTATNISVAIWRQKCIYETVVQGWTAVILLNISGKKSHIAKQYSFSRNTKLSTGDNHKKWK